MSEVPPPEIQLLHRRLSRGGGGSALVTMFVVLMGYFAFIGEIGWQRLVCLPVLFMATFGMISFVMKSAMNNVLKPLIDLLQSGDDWSKLSPQRELAVLRCFARAPMLMAASSLVMWICMGPLFLYIAEQITPGSRHTYADLAIGCSVAYPPIFLSTILRAELLLRPYLARARVQMKAKEVRLPFALNVRQRLLISTFLIGPYTLVAFALLTYRQLSLCKSLPDALNHFMYFETFFIVISALLSLCFAFYVIRVVQQPLDQIKAALSGESTEAPDTFDELGVIHQVLLERNGLEQAKQEFFAVVSHELRSPLMAIGSFLRLLADGVYGEVPEKVRAKAETAVSNSDRLLGLVTNILDAEKLQSGKFECIPAPTTTDVIVERAVSAVSELAEAQNIAITINACTENIVCDEERMVQVLINFLSNAVKNADAKPVCISVFRTDEEIEFGVRDQGAGIPVDVQQEVFEKFRQLQSDSAEKKKKGTGLGLPIAKALVEQHGGSIGVQSIVGEGSYFYARIPAEARSSL
jgi:signal transduction histidine kinase